MKNKHAIKENVKLVIDFNEDIKIAIKSYYSKTILYVELENQNDYSKTAISINKYEELSDWCYNIDTLRSWKMKDYFDKHNGNRPESLKNLLEDIMDYLERTL